MKKLKFSTGVPIWLLFLTLFISNCSCPCYLQQTFSNVSNVRSKTITLIDISSDSITNHRNEVEEMEKILENVIAENNSRKGCKEMSKIWSQFKNDSTGVYDIFISDWTKNHILPPVYIKSIKEDVNKILDEIEAGEKAIKEKRKPCK